MLHKILKVIYIVICWVEVTLFTLFLYLLSCYPHLLKQHHYHAMSRIWCRFLIRALNVDLRLHHKYKTSIPEHFILVANHPSAFEDFGIPALFNVYPLAKYGVKKWFLIGKISAAAGTMFVKRGDPESRQQALQDMINNVNSGKNISMFPEGGCYGRRITEKFHTGAFELAIKTGVPIVPVFLQYEEQETFEWQDPATLVDKFWHILNAQNNHVNYYIYDAINPKGFKNKIEFAEYVRQKFLIWQDKYLD